MEKTPGPIFGKKNTLGKTLQNKLKGSLKMEKIRNYIAGACGAVVACFASTPAFAALDLSSLTLDTTSPEALALMVLVGLASMWGIRKVVKLINRC
jgi:hypothetical protein